MTRTAFKLLIGLLFGVTMVGTGRAQGPTDANYDEAKTGSYTLPDPLTMENGRKVTSVQDWRQRRKELLWLFGEYVYGHTPPAARQARIVVEETARDPLALGGQAIRIEQTIWLAGRRDRPLFHLLVYLPRERAGRVPVFLGMNFWGNQGLHEDPGIRLSTAWMRADGEGRVIDHRATEKSRGRAASRWPLDLILAQGYGVATVYYGDLYPDHPAGRAESILPLFERRGRMKEKGAEWGAIGAWAWGLSRALDALSRMPEVNARKVALHGHSRLGKAALWAGAQDERFALVIANESGEGGAALARRNFGETVERINTSFPHWFCENYQTFNRRVAALPIDQHQLIALTAPRPIYLASAAEDLWADPRGEFLAGLAADPVYRLLGTDGLALRGMPEIHQPVHSTIGYHLRAGKHDVTRYDWEQFLLFANRHLQP
jgi:hypothetical protein